MSAPVIYATVAAVSAANQYQQGATQNALYQLRAEQASIEGERKKLQYEDQANRINESLLEVNSAVAARAASGGVRPFSGSSAMVSAMNNTKAGREWLNSVNAGKMALSAGEAEAGVLRASGRAAQQAGTIGALTTVAMAGGTIYAAGGFGASMKDLLRSRWS